MPLDEGAGPGGDGATLPLVAIAVSGCLGDDAVVAYAERRLAADQYAAASAHLDGCDDCLALVCAVVRSASEPPVASNALTQSTSGGSPTAGPETASLRYGEAVAGRYVLRAMVGQGAMGSVFAAHDTQLERKVALKLVRPERLELPGSRARFSREAKAMAKVTHPNVVRVYDAGEARGGVFLAMEFVEGTTLSRWLESSQRPWREVLEAFLAAGRGLAAAHEAGIVHRDFKPDNVLVDRAGRVAVSDFGLATAQGAALAGHEIDAFSLAEAATITRTGALLGTPRYMAPEQYAGGRADALSDQFGFAVALYEALYGEHPFGGETFGELRDAVCGGETRPVPAGSPVPSALRGVLLRALQADPAARHPSLEAFLAELDVAAKERERRAREPEQRASRLAKVASVSALVMAAAALSATVYRALGREGAPTPTASAPSHQLPSPGARAGGRTGVLFVDIAPPAGEVALDGTLEPVLAATLNSSKRLDPYWGDSLRALAAQVDGALGRVDERLAGALASRDGRPFVLARAAIAPQAGGFELSLRATDANSGQALFAAREASVDAPGLVAAALRLGRGLRMALGDPEPEGAGAGVLTSSLDALRAWTVGDRLASAGDNAGALEPLRRAVAIDPHFAEAHATLGRALSDLLRYADASPELELALRDGANLGERRRAVVLGDYYDSVGRYAEAIAAYERLLTGWPGDADVEMRVTVTALNAEAWPLALDLARRAATDHPKIVVTRTNLVIAYLASNAFDEAAREGGAVLAEFERVPSYGFAASAIAQTLAGKPTEAAATLGRLATLDPDIGDAARADLAFYEGRLDDAASLLKRQIDRATARGTPEDGRISTLNLARVLLRRGDKTAARAAALETLGGGNARTQYLVANLLVESGVAPRALEYASTWPEGPAPEWRMYAKLLRGDIQRVRGQARGAAAVYLDAQRIADTWIVHERLGRAYLAAGAWADAEREIAWCLAHGGEGAVFSNPGLSYLSALRYDLARAKDGAKEPDAAAAYRAFLEGEPAAQHDPLADDAHRRLAALEGHPLGRR